MGEVKITYGPEKRWLAENPDKAFAEKWFLILSPIWMTAMGVVMITGLVDSFNETIYNFYGMALALLFILVPAFMARSRTDLHQGLAWYQTCWFKCNVYMWSFAFFGSYFGTEYFFDVLGMVYDYPMIENTNLDSALVGSGEQKVPWVMYPLAMAYFMTYHTTAIVVLRRIKTSAMPAKMILWPVMIFIIGYFWAWMETKTMANPWIEQNFYYKDMDRMLAYGSAFYALYFIPSFPIYYFLDEIKEKPWSMWIVMAASLSASMLTMYFLDFGTHIVGPLH
jgi:cycloeucalenol cycloisomerase